MQKRGKLGSFGSSFIIILLSILLIGGLAFMASNYTKKATSDAEKDVLVGEGFEDSKITIIDVNIDDLHNSDMVVKIENNGRLVVERLYVEVMVNGREYKGGFPKDIEYSNGLLGLDFFQVGEFTVFFDDVDLSNYSKIMITPSVRLEDCNIKLIEAAVEEYFKGE